MDWTIYAFECADRAARDRLLSWFEDEHPVTVPEDRYSVFAHLDEPDGGQAPADYAWVGDYLYITVMGDPGPIVDRTADHWERAVVADVDSTTESVVDGTLYVADGEDGVETHSFAGPPEWAGNAVLYRLAMERQFRFRVFSAQSPTSQITPHPHAFVAPAEDLDLEEFVSKMASVTGVEPTDEGMTFLRDDPADDDRYVYGETYGPVDRD